MLRLAESTTAALICVDNTCREVHLYCDLDDNAGDMYRSWQAILQGIIACVVVICTHFDITLLATPEELWHHVLSR
ncbi:hypothetical protein CORC01_08765 [Colletotrichum orchidophilum]|uniref:Uncharacterized protein n=1 Tax=Colletotrichum orchidophilum TaxID=1209926 RepID=A0A1G4B3K1_9PEZI|nr:uncharacterized protein CORC01_08765 [Colletotrichum orchidophilum]OHE95913.1 hypothetical protein CORC01_08765 [Colletotrichum orchidophilum]